MNVLFNLSGILSSYKLQSPDRNQDVNVHANRQRALTCADMFVFSGFTTEAEGAGDGPESSPEPPRQRAAVALDDAPHVNPNARGQFALMMIRVCPRSEVGRDEEATS